jgi:aldehyde:ferredoxin oxidoreductase
MNITGALFKGSRTRRTAEGKICELEPMLKEYYRHRQWNWEDGYPSPEKLEQVGLDKEGNDT